MGFRNSGVQFRGLSADPQTRMNTKIDAACKQVNFIAYNTSTDEIAALSLDTGMWGQVGLIGGNAVSSAYSEIILSSFLACLNSVGGIQLLAFQGTDNRHLNIESVGAEGTMISLKGHQLENGAGQLLQYLRVGIDSVPCKIAIFAD